MVIGHDDADRRARGGHDAVRVTERAAGTALVLRIPAVEGMMTAVQPETTRTAGAPRDRFTGPPLRRLRTAATLAVVLAGLAAGTAHAIVSFGIEPLAGFATLLAVGQLVLA